MSYFDDLSVYEYIRDCARPGTRNVGWLAESHAFAKAVPSDALLDTLWAYCKVSVAATRGWHDCDWCVGQAYRGERNGEKLMLGTAEIRVFSAEAVFAAPTLIYHYVAEHYYQPPLAFVEALMAGPVPPAPAYFQRLEQLGLKWVGTRPFPDQPPRRFGA
jgi:hypothetical protein